MPTLTVKADPDKYAAMAAADRDLRLSGYDVFGSEAKELWLLPLGHGRRIL